MKNALRKIGSTYQAMVNKSLREAKTNRVANAIIQAALDGEVDARMAIPIVGRGDGYPTGLSVA